MTKPVRLDAEAPAEINAAVAWYEAQRAGLGLVFIELPAEFRVLAPPTPSPAKAGR